MIFVIFGGTGDLSYRKLLPALYRMAGRDVLDQDFRLIAISNDPHDSQSYRKKVQSALSDYLESPPAEPEALERFLEKAEYLQMELDQPEGYRLLKDLVASCPKGDRIFYYFAVTPELFPVIAEHLDEVDLCDHQKRKLSLLIEKPFGRDLKSAMALNRKLNTRFPEETIFRIDHYLGKPMARNILTLRFANDILEPLWNNRHIESIQITVSESAGVAHRGRFYDRFGALRDMVQSHLLQLTAITMMEPPESLGSDHVRDQKVQVLERLSLPQERDIWDNVVLGQYDANPDHPEVAAYQEEEDVAEDSLTETYAALRLFVHNDRWEGVPVYLRTGKRLARKYAQIVVTFRDTVRHRLFGDHPAVHANVLVISIQPDEAVSFRMNMENFGLGEIYSATRMSSCTECLPDLNTPEAYETLLGEAFRGERSSFTRWDEVEHAWRFVDQITRQCEGKRREHLKRYPVWTDGPKEADELLARHDSSWVGKDD